jgi:hypothetical protein
MNLWPRPHGLNVIIPYTMQRHLRLGALKSRRSCESSEGGSLGKNAKAPARNCGDFLLQRTNNTVVYNKYIVI